MTAPTDRDEAALDETGVNPDPIAQFRAWYAEAQAGGADYPEAMTLATATADGRPSARVVLLRGCDERGFAFYTNYLSRKGQELYGNPRAALVFYWYRLDRQVRIEGTVEVLTAAESDAYFRSRPQGHQLGALASPQSEVIAGREVLERNLAELTARYPEGSEVPRPPQWGGYRVVPEVIEFWQNRANRLHDRLRYRREGGVWVLERLAP
jgi:pyridoxamine 5'-phosphate oxidase